MARSEKHWVIDPQGIAWEHCHPLGSIPVFGEGSKADAAQACCTPAGTGTPAQPETSSCCSPAPRGKPIDITVTSASSCC